MKRLLTISLASALMVGSLVGCGENTDNNKDTETKQEQSVEKQDKVEEKDNKDSSVEKKDEKTEDKEEKDLVSWAGDWNNMGAYLDKPEIQTAFEKVAEKEGTKPEEEKAKYVEKRKTDFDGMSIEGNKITLYDGFKSEGGKEISSAEYTYVGEEKTKLENHDLTWYIYKTDDSKAKYKYFAMMPVHGDDGLKHFHFRYGNEEPKELLAKDGWFPTMVAPDSTDEQFIEEITE